MAESHRNFDVLRKLFHSVDDENEWQGQRTSIHAYFNDDPIFSPFNQSVNKNCPVNELMPVLEHYSNQENSVLDMQNVCQRFMFDTIFMMVTGHDPDYCERLGWKKLQEYDPTHKLWKHLSALAEGEPVEEDCVPLEDELGDEDYYPSLPFAAMFSCFKVDSFYSLYNVAFTNMVIGLLIYLKTSIIHTTPNKQVGQVHDLE